MADHTYFLLLYGYIQEAIERRVSPTLRNPQRPVMTSFIELNAVDVRRAAHQGKAAAAAATAILSTTAVMAGAGNAAARLASKKNSRVHSA